MYSCTKDIQLITCILVQEELLELDGEELELDGDELELELELIGVQESRSYMYALPSSESTVVFCPAPTMTTSTSMDTDMPNLASGEGSDGRISLL